MFGPRWFIVFLPLLVFWSGAWLRKSHSVWGWSIGGTLLAYSVLISLIGMTDPFVNAGASTFTPYAAVKQLFHHAPATPAPNDSPTILADREDE